jgi:hypothetical protein
MWAFLLRRVRVLLVVVLLLPVVGAVARRLADRSERRHEGPTLGSRVLRLVDATTTRLRRVLR